MRRLSFPLLLALCTLPLGGCQKDEPAGTESAAGAAKAAWTPAPARLITLEALSATVTAPANLTPVIKADAPTLTVNLRATGGPSITLSVEPNPKHSMGRMSRSGTRGTRLRLMGSKIWTCEAPGGEFADLGEAICQSLTPTTEPAMLAPDCTVEGLEQDAVLSAFTDIQPKVRSCFEASADTNPTIMGDSWTVTLSRKGRSTSASASTSDKTVRECLAPMLKAIQSASVFTTEADFTTTCRLRWVRH